MLVGCSHVLFAQQTTVFTEAQYAYKKGSELFEKGVYGQAQHEFKRALNLLSPTHKPAYEMLIKKAELGYAQSVVRQELPDGEKIMLDFIRKYSPDPVANQALVEVANFYYNARKYEKAITYFNKIPTDQLSGEQRSEVHFKLGYSYFVRKKFPQAKASFNKAKAVENQYYYPTNYYYGLCEFFQGRYDSAINSFRIAEKSKRYKRYIPYYIAQIYRAEGDFDKLIDYAAPKANSSQVKNRKELNQLVGQAYFEREDYEKALPYLEYYAERQGKLREEEFYQLGYTQYRSGKYKSAAKNFEQLSSVSNELSQYAFYYLGDSNLKIGNKTAARNAFGSAARLNYDPNIREEANFSYAKLSFELGYDREAISALQTIEDDSKYYSEGQSLMGKIFQSTQDYERAITTMENMTGKRTPQMREAYQKVCYLQGLKLYKENRLDEAITLFAKSNTEPVNSTVRAACIYWQGDIAHRRKKYNQSIQQLNQFLTLAKTLRDLPEESSVYTANYTQGYNYLKQENFTSALGYFQEAVATISRNRPFIRNVTIKEKILGDATLRAGDCYFKRNQYNDAVRFYDQAIKNKYADYIYALYQKAIIEGLRGKTTEKVLALENIAENYPESKFADDALLSLGITYQDINQLSKAQIPLRKLITDYRGKSDLIVQGLLRLGLISFNQGNLSTAIDYYKQIFSNNPEPGEAKDALTALQEIYIDNLGDPDGYTRFLETIPGYELNNFDKDSLNFKAAEAQYENGNFQRAVDAYTEYIRKFPNGQNRLQAQYHRGESYFELRQYDKALEDFEYVAGRGPSRYYVGALEFSAAISYNFTQDFQKSFSYYEQMEKSALSEDKRFEAQLGAMESGYRINNTQAVYTYASKVLNNPSASLSQKSKANFYLGKMAFDNKDYTAALTSFNQVTRTNDDVEAAESRYLIAYIYYIQRQLNVAEQRANEAIQENGAYPYWIARSMILLADVYADLGDLFNARAVLEALLENYDGDQEILNQAQQKLDQLNAQSSEGSRLDRSTDDGDFEFDEGGF